MPRLRVARPAGRNRDRGEDTTGVLGSPRQSAEAAVFDELRRSEYGRLDAGGHVYLDYTGAGLYAHSQLAEHLALLRQSVFGNPHSLNPTSAATTELVEQARAAVLRFFRASPEEYVAIFTPNATGALRLVGEAYPFHAGDRFLLTFDNHNSVNGIREFARARGAETTYVPSEAPELRVDDHLLPRYLTEVVGEHHNLFAYPAQSNFSGVQHPLAWIEQAQAHGWDVLLDAAAYVPTNRLDLSRWHPDFVALSFYKMFGWPTGVGALLARRDALATLERPWFSGGTIVAAFVQREWYQSAPGAAHFEDGTVDFLNLPAVEIGLRFLDRIGIDAVHAHVQALAGRLLETLESLRHANGAPAVTIYGPRDLDRRGATVAFNFLHPEGRIVDERYVDRVARRHKISLRTGCFCNPGAGEVAFTISGETLVGGEFGDGMTLDDYIRAIGLPSGGAVRASLGLASTIADIHHFAEFAAEFVDLAAVPDDLPPRTGC
ncbi:MAG TPA: aminotransferase class V-fold PLP-dependent enzyme [Gaiellaceae bacterium]|nr:aminotransferase class V-fold PLP-dependent enzyme [Gaiellaceae bacterium]